MKLFLLKKLLLEDLQIANVRANAFDAGAAVFQRHQLEALDGVPLRGELLGALLGQHPVVGWTVHCCVLFALFWGEKNEKK